MKISERKTESAVGISPENTKIRKRLLLDLSHRNTGFGQLTYAESHANTISEWIKIINDGLKTDGRNSPDILTLDSFYKEFPGITGIIGQVLQRNAVSSLKKELPTPIILTVPSNSNIFSKEILSLVPTFSEVKQNDGFMKLVENFPKILSKYSGDLDSLVESMNSEFELSRVKLLIVSILLRSTGNGWQSLWYEPVEVVDDLTKQRIVTPLYIVSPVEFNLAIRRINFTSGIGAPDDYDYRSKNSLGSYYLGTKDLDMNITHGGLDRISFFKLVNPIIEHLLKTI